MLRFLFFILADSPRSLYYLIGQQTSMDATHLVLRVYYTAKNRFCFSFLHRNEADTTGSTEKPIRRHPLVFGITHTSFFCRLKRPPVPRHCTEGGAMDPAGIEPATDLS